MRREEPPGGGLAEAAANDSAEAAEPIPIHHAAVTLAALAPEEHARLAGHCSEREHAQAERFMFAEDRIAYLAAHGLLRLSLTALWPLREPWEWRFGTGPHGKPHLADPELGHIRFNLSHCRSRVAVVAAEHLDCGIDVEPASRDGASDVLLASCLSEAERIWLEARPAAGRGADFLRLWTLKEAVSKALGLGLSLPFDTISLDLSAAPALASIGGYEPRNFWLDQAIEEDHVESIAVLRTKYGSDLPEKRRINLVDQGQFSVGQDHNGELNCVLNTFSCAQVLSQAERLNANG